MGIQRDLFIRVKARLLRDAYDLLEGDVPVFSGGELLAVDSSSASPGDVLTSGGPGVIPVWAPGGVGGGVGDNGPDLTAIEALSGTGQLTRIAADTWALRNLVPPAAGLTIANPAGVAGPPTFALANDLAGLEAITGTGIVARIAADTYATRSMVAPAAGLTIADPGGVAGPPTFALADDLAGLEAVTGTGIFVRTAANVYATRTLAIGAGSTGLTGANLDGVAGPPTITLDPYAVLALVIGDHFGDGSDGALTLTGNITLARDGQYTTLDLAGFRIDSNGFMIRCHELRNTTGSGLIRNNGGDFSGLSAGGGASGGSLGGGTAGVAAAAAGASGTSAATRANSWTSRAGTVNVSGRGGSGGGSGGAPTGGAGGTVTDPSALNGYGGLGLWDTGRLRDGTVLNGGSGGGGGGAQAGAGARGGATGGGGGVILVFARHLHSSVTSLTLQANGGNSGNGTAGAAPGTGGGGGGGGGMVVLTYQTKAALPTLQANGGAAGTGTGTGANGVAGNAGVTILRPMWT